MKQIGDLFVVLASVTSLIGFAFLSSAEPNEDACAEHLRRWGDRMRGCPDERTAGDRWAEDHAPENLDDEFASVRIDDSGDALLWIDERGNLGLAAGFVERVVYFDAGRRPRVRMSAVSQRCRETIENAPPGTEVAVCLSDDSLAHVLYGPR